MQGYEYAPDRLLVRLAPAAEAAGAEGAAAAGAAAAGPSSNNRATQESLAGGTPQLKGASGLALLKAVGARQRTRVYRITDGKSVRAKLEELRGLPGG